MDWIYECIEFVMYVVRNCCNNIVLVEYSSCCYSVPEILEVFRDIVSQQAFFTFCFRELKSNAVLIAASDKKTTYKIIYMQNSSLELLKQTSMLYLHLQR